MTLRATQDYRRENGGWRIVHRHGDILTDIGVKWTGESLVHGRPFGTNRLGASPGTNGGFCARPRAIDRSTLIPVRRGMGRFNP
jgi:hypothetical protein